MENSIDDEDEAAAIEQRLAVRRRRNSLVNWVMDGVYGREFVHGILDRTGPFRSAFNPDSDRMTVYLLGQQDVGRFVLAELNDICPEKVQLMMREAHDRNSRNASPSSSP